MAEQNIGQILQAFNSIESKIREQSGLLKALTAQVKALEGQNKQLVQLVHQLKSPSTPPTDQFESGKAEFQNSVTKSLKSIEEQSKKTMDMIKANGGAKKRAWP
ncbi:hypothetical protein HUO09_08075 [Vibrio sp. Y2-5]|uniref:hypothetical protein n=1 Tax=Vibrio TaxID=662 RepID=UPI00142DDFA8|nr:MULTISPECIES: hypothetical protein [Vibrio]MBD0786300.1 hypothetical protein [Vibrio sp. Y2-5]NIY92138.1 hypothetical protein [Vibrio diazotrophicus]